MKTIKVLEAGRWIVYATIPEQFVELYIRYAKSRGYAKVAVV